MTYIYMNMGYYIFMKKFKMTLGAFTIFFLIVMHGIYLCGVYTASVVNMTLERGTLHSSDDFYFVHLTDTHVMHRLFDWTEASKKRLQSVLASVSSSERKPAFVVITGDLTNWGSSPFSGALNCLAFISCFYTTDGQLYADEAHTIPVYTTPGNHEYIYMRNLRNYHRFIENKECYIVNYSDLSVFFLTSGPSSVTYLSGGDGLYDSDMKWFEDALQQCSSRFKIVCLHHPAVYLRRDDGKMRNVIQHNREVFVNACMNHSVELVLNGHTHESRVFDAAENQYDYNVSYNCSVYPTLFVHTTDCKEHGAHSRTIRVIANHLWVEPCVDLTANTYLFGCPAVRPEWVSRIFFRKNSICDLSWI